MTDTPEVKLSPTQAIVLRWLCSYGGSTRQLSGNGMAPYVSSAKSLVRKGLAEKGSMTSDFRPTDAGKKLHWATTTHCKYKLRYSCFTRNCDNHVAYEQPGDVCPTCKRIVEHPKAKVESPG